jgi:Holliday junction resolvase RusA-like endonuclease
MITAPAGFYVLGIPIKQGDMVCYGRGGRHQLTHKDEKTLFAWRDKIAAGARLHVAEQADLHQPIELELTWSLPRPASHWGTGRNFDVLKASAPAYPTEAGTKDVDKLERAVLDSLQQAGTLVNDAQVVDLHGFKRWAWARFDPTGADQGRPDLYDVLPQPGLVIRIYPKDPQR